MKQPREHDDILRFRQLAERVTELGARGGYRLRPYTHSDLPHLRAQSSSARSAITRNLATYAEICARTHAAGSEMRDVSRLVWYAVRTLGLIPPEGLFERLCDEQVVMIHDRRHQQLFRNFAFFDVCSYTLEELYTAPWMSLYHSAQGYDVDLARIAQALGPELGHVMRADAPKHRTFETRSSAHFEIDFEMRYLAGLRGRHSPRAEAYLTVSDARLVAAHGPRARLPAGPYSLTQD